MKTYSLKKNEAEITLETLEGKTEVLCLREMTAAKRDQYLDRLTKRIKIGPDGSSQGVAKFDGLQADLISSCLYRGEVLVSIAEVQGWPAAVVAGIFKDAQEMNKLGQEHAEALEKNE
jgi:hypothetical protein